MIYRNFEISKDGQKIPVFLSGKLFHSKYNPEREAKMLVENTKKSDFFLITGLGAGFYLKEMQKKFPDSFFLVLEESSESINFLLTNLPELKNLQNEKTVFCTIENLEQKLLEYYIPAIYSTFSVFTIKSWLLENNEKLILQKINSAISNISKDFSVQAHFGKLWQNNIMQNVKLANKNVEIAFPLEKECIVVAAGPSLDLKIDFLKKNREQLFILATDTAFLALENQNIISDAVISIDGQMISYKHFSKKTKNNTFYIFDLAANSSAVRKIKKSSEKIIFTVSGHPFEQLCKKISPDSFLSVDSSSGTVTIAAVDFALQVGFSKIKILGADFGYILRKPYAKGTYLDNINYKNQKKNFSAEKEFLKTMFRTPLIKISEKKYTTEVLNFYEKNLYEWCKKNQCKISKENDIFCLEKDNLLAEKTKKISLQKFDIQNLKKNLLKKENEKQIINAMLPYISYLKNEDSKNGKNKTFSEYSKLALNFILRYNF